MSTGPQGTQNPINTDHQRGLFEVGAKVTKPVGYPFPGTVVAAFDTMSGARRYVVESSTAPGLLHIFSGFQLSGAEE